MGFWLLQEREETRCQIGFLKYLMNFIYTQQTCKKIFHVPRNVDSEEEIYL